jgi:hypothetical protein
MILSKIASRAPRDNSHNLELHFVLHALQENIFQTHRCVVNLAQLVGNRSRGSKQNVINVL